MIISPEHDSSLLGGEGDQSGPPRRETLLLESLEGIVVQLCAELLLECLPFFGTKATLQLIEPSQLKALHPDTTSESMQSLTLTVDLRLAMNTNHHFVPFELGLRQAEVLREVLYLSRSLLIERLVVS